ncbi:MAG: hypothetical protein ABW292_20845 [Vicinamibacterales bacterium]
MHLDLRYPIGLLLTTYGAILAFEGAMFRATVLDLNVNLYWGAVMIVCGLGAIVLARSQITRHRSQVTNQKSEMT